MSWGLLKGFGQGLQSVGDTMMRDTLQRQREEWQRKYLEETRQKQWDREDTKDAAALEREAAKTVVDTKLEKGEDGISTKVGYNAAGEKVSSEQYVSKADTSHIKAVGNTLVDSRNGSVIFKGDKKLEIKDVETGETDSFGVSIKRTVVIERDEDGSVLGYRPLEEVRDPLPEMTPTEKEYFDGLSQQYPNRSRDEILSKAKEMAAKDGQQVAPEPAPKPGDPPPTQQDVGPSWMERASNWVGSGSDEPGKKYGAGFDEIIGKPASVVGGLLTRGAEAAGGAVDSMNSNIEQHRALQEVRSAMSMNRNVSPKALQMALPLITDPQEREKVLSLLSRMQ